MNGTTKISTARSPAITAAPRTSESRDESGESNKSDTDAEQNRRIADYTLELARYTKALVAVGIIQALIFTGHFWVFSKTLSAAREATAEQSRLTRRSNAITRRAVRETERSNAANEALTQESNFNTRTGTDLTRQSLVLSHPPRVVVRNIEITPRIFDFRSAPGGVTQGPVMVTGTARLFNKGGSTAYVTGWCCHVFLFDVLPMKLPFSPPESDLGLSVALPPGKFGTMPLPTGQRGPIEVAEMYQLGCGTRGIFVMGEVIYRDEFLNIRTTSFCREWRYGDQYFKIVNNLDYEDAE